MFNRKKGLYTVYFKSLFLLLFTIVTYLTCVGGEDKVYAYNLGDKKDLVPKVYGSVINFGSMRESSGSVYHDYAYRDISGGKLILLDVNNKTLWRSYSNEFTLYFTMRFTRDGVDHETSYPTNRSFTSLVHNLSFNFSSGVERVRPIKFEFIGYAYTGTALEYKANQTTSLKFNDKSLEQFKLTLSSITVGTTIPIKIHKKYVGRLIVRKSNKNVLYLEKDSSDNTNIVDIIIDSKPDYVEQEISVVPLINTRDYLTRLGGKSSISKTLTSN